MTTNDANWGPATTLNAWDGEWAGWPSPPDRRLEPFVADGGFYAWWLRATHGCYVLATPDEDETLVDPDTLAPYEGDWTVVLMDAESAEPLTEWFSVAPATLPDALDRAVARAAARQTR